MSELTKIAAILFKNLSDALLATSSQLAKLDMPLSQTEFEENPEIASLKIGDFVICNYKNRRIGGDIMAIAQTGEITVFNAAMDKTIVVTISQVVYKRVDAYEIG
jgi:hypothetical protein